MKEKTLVPFHIRTEDGYDGWGEATTIGGLNYAEESPHSIKTNIDTYFTPPYCSKKRPRQPLRPCNC